VGKIESRWLPEEQKMEILVVIEEAKSQGVTKSCCCAMWMIDRRRVVRWSNRLKRGERLANGKPGLRDPAHRLLPEERRAVLVMAGKEQYADFSHRILAVTAWDRDLFFVSFSSVYRILRSEGLMSMRGHHGHHNGRSLPPERKELTGPNQRWCWDISYLPTYERGLFLYLYLLLDEYSRKVIYWLISWQLRAQEARRLLEEGLLAENILDLPREQRPEVINDRGRQMKAGQVKRVFELHGMPQLFARPRTPNDNPFVESAFGTVKTAPAYPGRFLDREEALGYFESYFRWYNTEHLHSGIDFVTPEQCHLGLRDQIVAERRAKLDRHRRLRETVNRRARDLSLVPYDGFTTLSTLGHVA
jgi:transposase InsO family protein